MEVGRKSHVRSQRHVPEPRFDARIPARRGKTPLTRETHSTITPLPAFSRLETASFPLADVAGEKWN